MTEFEDTAASDSESDEESAAPVTSLDDIDMDSDEEVISHEFTRVANDHDRDQIFGLAWRQKSLPINFWLK